MINPTVKDSFTVAKGWRKRGGGRIKPMNTTQTKVRSTEEALKMALEALSKSDDFLFDWHENESDNEADAYATARQLNEKAITAIKEALAQPQQCKYGQEPKSCTSSPMDCQCAIDATLARPEQCRKEQHGNGEYVCNCKSGECPELAQPEQEPVELDGWKWMTHPSRNSGNPIPVQIYQKDGVIYYSPFDTDSTEFEWAYKDEDWREVTPPPHRKPLTDEQRTALRDAFAQALTGVYVCGRVWEAWQYGTMSEGDFQPASECEEVLDSIIEAAHGIKE